MLTDRSHSITAWLPRKSPRCFPSLRVRNASGEVETVHYETLNVLLLNEVQHQEQRIEALERRLAEWMAEFEARSSATKR